MLPLGGLHGKHAVQRGIWVQTQHLLWDQGKPRKTLIELAIAGPSGCKLTSSQHTVNTKMVLKEVVIKRGLKS
jgi:hypothetical protein